MLRENLEYNKNVKANSAFLEELKLKLPEFFTAEKKDDDGNVVEESKFDYLKFKKMLDEQNIEEFTSGYQLDFIGKNYAKKQSGERPNTVIVPDIEHNTKMENKNSKNIFLTGDNLEVLRHLKQNYNDSIDVIYIDPPYNTDRNDFVYSDSFEYKDEELINMFGLSDENLRKLKSIQGKSTHSAWLTFVYPRLFLAKKLLKDTGVIFASIDDNEQANFKLLMDDIFGEASFISEFIITRSEGGGLAKQVITGHDYLLVYAKNISKFIPLGKPKDIRGKVVELNGEDYWIETDWLRREFGKYGTLFYEEILQVHGQEKKIDIDQGIENGNYVLIPKGDKHIVGRYRKVSEDSSKFYSIQKHLNKEGNNRLNSLNLEGVFSYPKPVSLVKDFVQGTRNMDATILDFFAGSGTAADAVMQLNAEDGGNRKFILCTLPEKTYTVNADGTEIPTKGGAVAYEAGFKSIDEISRERIKRAAEKIKQENPDLADSLDLGFKHYRVVSPSVETLEDIEFDDVMQLDLLEDMISKFSSENLGVDGNATGIDTILQTYLVQDGYKFDVNIEYIELGEYKVPYINNQRIYIISNNWNNKATEKLVNMIGRNEIKVQTIVVYGYSFDAKNLRTLEYALNQLDNKVNLQIRY